MIQEAKGTPFRTAKARCRYLLEDFTDADCRAFLESLVNEMTSPGLLEAIAAYWEAHIELLSDEELLVVNHVWKQLSLF